jgi:predicted nucleotidyltransferase
VNTKNSILKLIKDSIGTSEPKASVILYGSYAREDSNEDSDIDLIVLVDRDNLTPQEKDKITYPLYKIGIKTDTIISPIVYTRKAWINHRVTPFYENVNREGKAL